MAHVEIVDGEFPVLHQALPALVGANALGIARQFWVSSRFYDDAGRVWRGSPATGERTALSFVQRMLAHTVYNPVRTVRMVYEIERDYVLAELTQRIGKAVEHDDDILTQFMDGDEIRRRLTLVRRFSELVSLLQEMASEQEATAGDGQ